MKYQIIIQPNGPHKISASLISRFLLFWFIPIWVEEDEIRGSAAFVRDAVARWRLMYNIPFTGVTDLTKVAP